MKRVRWIFLALALVLALSACAGTPAGNTSTPATSAPKADTPATAAPQTDNTADTDKTDSAPADPVVKLKFAGVTAQAAKDAAEVFKEVAERESNGSLEFTLYPDNMLADDRVAVETTQFGDIDMSTSSTSPLCTMFDDFYLFDSPYLFLSKQEVYDFIDSADGQELLAGLEKIGLKGIALWENGFRNYTNNKVPASKPEDVAGMKVRTMENEVHLAAWKAFGANPTPMAFTELFTALQQGTVDAQENPLGIIDANKFYEVQKYVSLTQHVYTPFVIVMNLDKWNSLTDNQKAAMEKATKESTEFQRKRSQELEDEILAGFEGHGVTVVKLSDEEKAAFQKLVSDNKVFDMVKGKMSNPKFLDAILNK